MTPSMLSLQLGILGLMLHILIVIMGVRFLSERAPVLIHLSGAIVAESLFVMVSLIVPQEIPFWHGSIVLGWGVIFWLFAFSAVYKSVSLSMLLRLNAAPQKDIAIPQFTAALIQPTFTDRIRVLEKMGYITAGDEAYDITPSGERFVARFTKIRRIFGVTGDGFYGN